MKRREYAVQGRNGYWGIDEYGIGHDGRWGMLRNVECVNTRKLARSIAGALNGAIYDFCKDNGIEYPDQEATR